MRSTKAVILAVASAGLLSVAGCGTSDSSDAKVPRIAEVGSRAHIFQNVSELTERASAVVVATSTGQVVAKPFPDGGAPTVYVRMHVSKVISGATSSPDIEVVTPGDDIETGKPALLTGGKYLLFLTPAMYAANDPAGGYAIVGGPAGAYVARAKSDQFTKIDAESKALPQTITLGATHLPAVTKSERQLLQEGPA
ncbi:MAG: hypothetical protein QOE58_2390 [Actinomycetota bacterium]|nr:hypothetical protein [Actinomycetota bacterium]